jgi:16S rRNA (cytidine1402-2'-O)-methyltransferase
MSLTLVPTPIGNLKDITLRALETLQQVDLILSEDTRTSGILLKHYNISKPLQSFHIFNEHKTLQKIISLLKEGKKVALISDAGTPAISDPGFLIVRECIAAGIDINCLPGATALIPALVVSGLPTESFVFEGFLPLKKGRQSKFIQLQEEQRTMVFYESPHRIIKTLEECIKYFGENRPASVSREISKLFEENIRGTLSEILSIFTQKSPKGEFVVCIQGKSKKEK